MSAYINKRGERIAAEELTERVEARKERSAWRRGVKAAAIDLIDDFREHMIVAEGRDELRLALLNGADDWKEFSWGGSGLIYNEDIARRYCSPSEYRKTRGGDRRPNAREEWLDVQARALYQAYRMIYTEAER